MIQHSYEGNATNLDWPGIDSTVARGVTGAAGSGLRAGSYSYIATRLEVSLRYLAGEIQTGRTNCTMRMVRQVS